MSRILVELHELCACMYVCVCVCVRRRSLCISLRRFSNELSHKFCRSRQFNFCETSESEEYSFQHLKTIRTMQCFISTGYFRSTIVLLREMRFRRGISFSFFSFSKRASFTSRMRAGLIVDSVEINLVILV